MRTVPVNSAKGLLGKFEELDFEHGLCTDQQPETLPSWSCKLLPDNTTFQHFSFISIRTTIIDTRSVACFETVSVL
jgi:hypothetical protein